MKVGRHTHTHTWSCGLHPGCSTSDAMMHCCSWPSYQSSTTHQGGGGLRMITCRARRDKDSQVVKNKSGAVLCEGSVCSTHLKRCLKAAIMTPCVCRELFQVVSHLQTFLLVMMGQSQYALSSFFLEQIDLEAVEETSASLLDSFTMLSLLLFLTVTILHTWRVSLMRWHPFFHNLSPYSTATCLSITFLSLILARKSSSKFSPDSIFSQVTPSNPCTQGKFSWSCG